MRLFRHFNDRKRRLLLVLPGQSADHVLDCLGFGHVAVVNRAALFTPGPLEFACCNDLESLESIRPAWNRISKFLIPDQLTIAGQLPGKTWGEFPDVPYERALVFPATPNNSEANLLACIDSPDHLAGYTGSDSGLHAAVRLGYEQIWILGCDGGTGYASILHYGGYGAAYNFDAHRQRMKFIRSELRKSVTGVDIRFWPERF